MSSLNVSTVVGIGSSPVNFPTGITGKEKNIFNDPKILYVDPPVGSTITLTPVNTPQEVQFVFDRQLQISGIGTVEIRLGTKTGSIATSFLLGSNNATISNNTLSIKLNYNEVGIGSTNFIIIPSKTIQNLEGIPYKGSDYSFFNIQEFEASGGNSVFTISSPESATGYFKYHLFTSTGILTTTSPTAEAVQLSSVLVGGGGGGGSYAPPVTTTFGGGGGAGGLIYWNDSSNRLSLNSGSYTITIGGGGSGTTPGSSGGTNSSISSPRITIESIGGGKGNGPVVAAPTISGGSGGGATSPTPTAFGIGLYNQGFPGGEASPNVRGGGGGGAAGIGISAGSPVNPGKGGDGVPLLEFNSNILGPNTPVPILPAAVLSGIGTLGYYAGGGGGGGSPFSGSGGLGGGGGGQVPSPTQNGVQNTGGGGVGNDPSPTAVGGNGGSGIFIIRYAVKE